jgi:hypothetical protein
MRNISFDVGKRSVTNSSIVGIVVSTKSRWGMNTNPLAPDTLAFQQFALVFQTGRDVPEKRLLVAVLMNAFAELEDALEEHGPRSEWALRELLTWFFNHDRTWLFSFESLCEELDLSPDCVRKQLRVLVSCKPQERIAAHKGH